MRIQWEVNGTVPSNYQVPVRFCPNMLSKHHPIHILRGHYYGFSRFNKAPDRHICQSVLLFAFHKKKEKKKNEIWSGDGQEER